MQGFALVTVLASVPKAVAPLWSALYLHSSSGSLFHWKFGDFKLISVLKLILKQFLNSKVTSLLFKGVNVGFFNSNLTVSPLNLLRNSMLETGTAWVQQRILMTRYSPGKPGRSRGHAAW